MQSAYLNWGHYLTSVRGSIAVSGCPAGSVALSRKKIGVYMSEKSMSNLNGLTIACSDTLPEVDNRHEGHGSGGQLIFRQMPGHARSRRSRSILVTLHMHHSVIGDTGKLSP